MRYDYHTLAQMWSEDPSISNIWAESALYQWQREDINGDGIPDEQGDWIKVPYSEEQTRRLQVEDPPALQQRVDNIIERYDDEVGLSDLSLAHRPVTWAERVDYFGFNPLSKMFSGQAPSRFAAVATDVFTPKDFFEKETFDGMTNQLKDWRDNQKKWLEDGYIDNEEEIKTINDLDEYL